MVVLKVWYRFMGILLKLWYRLIFGRGFSCGRRVHMRKGFQMTIESKASIQLGDDVFFNNRCALHAMERIEIGKGTIFGENVLIYDHNHRFADESVAIKKQGYATAPVIIGDHCWIGSNVTILKGAVIGDNVVIGAGCVIDKEIPSDTVVRLHQDFQFQEVRH